MADGGRDAQGDAQGKERPSKPKAKRGGSGRKQTGTATPSKQSEREPEIAPNLRELLELCARVLPQGSYSANSSGSNALPLREISAAYREHLRQKDVTPTDALPLPANMMRMMAPGQAGNRPLAGCRHKTCFFVGPAPELAAIEHVLRESVGTEISAAGIPTMLARVAAESAGWKQKFVEAPMDAQCMDILKQAGFQKVLPSILTDNVGDDDWGSLSAAPMRVAPERPATQESIHESSSDGGVTLAHIEKICNAWPTPPWQTVRELFELFEETSLAAGGNREPPIRLWAKVRGLGSLRKPLMTLALQYINLIEMVKKEMSRRPAMSRTQAIDVVDNMRKRGKKQRLVGGNFNVTHNTDEGWTIKDIERPPPSTSSQEKEAYLETAKKLAQHAVGANDTRGGARSGSTSDA